jgi:glutamate carboxypeptidase
MTSENMKEYGRLKPMLDALEKLVRCESPSEDLAACRAVVDMASQIAHEVLGTPAQVKEIEGRPIFWWGSYLGPSRHRLATWILPTNLGGCR